MERRTFFKNLFGAAVVAAMPSVVVREIERIAPETITPIPVIKKPIVIKPLKKVIGIDIEKILYIHDKNKLIAASTQFTFEMKRDIISKPYEGIYPEFKVGPLNWHIAAYQLQCFNNVDLQDYLVNYTPLDIIIHYDKMNLQGQAYINNCQLTFGELNGLEQDVDLTGIGFVILNENDSTITKTEIGKAEGSKTSSRKEFADSAKRIQRN